MDTIALQAVRHEARQVKRGEQQQKITHWVTAIVAAILALGVLSNGGL